MTTTYSFLHCGGCFADETGLVGSPLVLSGISGTSCLKAGCPSCHPLCSVKKLKETQSTDPAWPHLFFIHRWTLMEVALLLSCRLCDAHTSVVNSNLWKQILILLIGESVCRQECFHPQQQFIVSEWKHLLSFSIFLFEGRTFYLHR